MVARTDSFTMSPFSLLIAGKYMPMHTSKSMKDQKVHVSYNDATAPSNAVAARANVQSRMRLVSCPTHSNILEYTIEPNIVAHMRQLNIKPKGKGESESEDLA